ncbi:MAG: lysine--tRNA ligase [SAR86 cluster bacterium]|uniref:Lysine--tRNA ligase n=1 Tax=SAR86 cluster bacterium TaxID=2030880 RepID=A0A2A5C7V9_9GAMM|nr:lysine--tRNA ligase [Gammaproteobacteria bacterium AH-315-E17]PCJ39964.1 MAG: lysine--tRNA ligase [SAR86 cluster bacterium]
MSENQENNNPVDENKLIQQRREKLQKIRQQGNAFPNDFRRSAFADELHNEFDDETKEAIEDVKRVVSVAGRVIRMRGPFIVLLEGSGQIQLYLNFKSFDEAKKAEIKSWDLGDIVAATGEVFKTGKGEVSVRVSEIQLLTKSLRPLPDKHKGLTDTEVRYRQRYVDLIVNEEVRETFVIRSKIVDAIRRFMNADNFMEVETPMLQIIPGGATARPFITHHNALDQDMYLRVAPELYLKRLVVGGFERVYEINRNFRNEGLSTRHNPEFTMLEFYQAYTDYHHLMDFTEKMLRQIAEEVIGETTIVYQDIALDFAKPFTRMSVVDAIVNNVDGTSASQLTNIESVRALAEKLGIAVKETWGVGKLQMEIFEEKVEHLLLQPTFITEYPTEVSPLARRNDNNPELSDRFELFIAGREIANGFSELNDPEDQAERFHAQVAEKDAGDDEAMHFDSDYITALEYGMPPTAGEGIGIDRLVMLYTDSPSIRDVLLFPHMRPQHS